MHFAPIFQADRFAAAKRLVPGRLPFEPEAGRSAADGLLVPLFAGKKEAYRFSNL